MKEPAISLPTFLVLGILCAFVACSKKQASKGANHLSWFELQICPDVFRLAAIPNQPILLFVEPVTKDDKGSTLLIQRAINPPLFDNVYVALDKLINENHLWSLTQHNPDACFSDDAMSSRSIHLCFRYTDGKQWASVYPVDSAPALINDFIVDCRELTTGVAIAANGKPLTAEEALNSCKEPSMDHNGHSDAVTQDVARKK
jgi:hypothetical protein